MTPLIDLLGECGQLKTQLKSSTKPAKWYWNETHQKSFDVLKKVIAPDVMLAYPNFDLAFEIYTDASLRQMGSVIVQNNRAIAFFSRKLNDAQRNYTTTEKELLSIIETLKEFKSILWGQKIKVYTDHKNLVHKASGSSSEQVMRWHILLEEYDPEIVYIKRFHNTVADAISRL